MGAHATLRLAADAGGIAEAARLLRDGRIVAFPTETVYGLGADATDGRSVAKVYAAKGRPSFNPLIAHVADAGMAGGLVEMTDAALRLAEAFWPGPLTLVLPRRGAVSDLVTAGLDTLAVRVPAQPVARALLSAVGRPVAAPSANPSGRISPTEAAHVLDGLDGRIDAVLDGGPCTVGVESTILGWKDGVPVLLRPGGLPVERIEEVLGQRVAHRSGEAINAPGQLSSHYAPEAALRLNADAPEPEETWLRFGDGASDWSLSPTGDLEEAAARLFGLLRRADAAGRPIAVAPIPTHGLGAAINDRLARAAAPRP
ncbi:L-threonylcarbamoyladenylate synthase [Roseobacter sp. HKCCA0434]|uniref:L-threonylcarbamoyladenylate synthase n=1 Tax=Roseobacter sp. HKCCA0434 TaxID=3079297 RepID=UPI002905AEF7|nr:L-threonylcarbamoyladenylate synthase [Roseobacter sp. HKCCA0434]